MKNPNIAKVLKEYRKLNHYSVEDVVIKLKDHNLPFAVKTVYGWESGQTQPDADTLLVLCKIYKIDNILETFGYEVSSSPFSANILKSFSISAAVLGWIGFFSFPFKKYASGLLSV